MEGFDRNAVIDVFVTKDWSTRCQRPLSRNSPTFPFISPTYYSCVYLIYPQLHPSAQAELGNMTEPKFLGGGEGSAAFLLNQALSILIFLMLCQRIFQNGFK